MIHLFFILFYFIFYSRIIKDNFIYARVARFIGDRSKFSEDSIDELASILTAEDDPEATARSILEASKSSMGMDIREEDLNNVESFTGMYFFILL